MLAPLNLALVALGLVLVFLGATVSVYTITISGFVIGAGAGYVVAPHAADFFPLDPALVSVGFIAIGCILGTVLAYAGISFTAPGISATAGGMWVVRFSGRSTQRACSYSPVRRSQGSFSELD